MATIIDPAQAKSLIQEYQSQNTAAGGPAIITPDGKFLNGYFLDRESLETLLSNPDVIGVSLLLAKDPKCVGSKTNQFTVLFAGAETSEPGAPEAYKNTGAIFGDSPPCPPMCISLG